MFQPAEYEPVEIDITAPDNKMWREIMDRELSEAGRFEIHCWNEEQKEIRTALSFGQRKESPWAYGKVIAGPVTKIFRYYLLSLPKPDDCEVCNKMTPFFSIFLDNGFSSEHYGTELYRRKTK